MSTAGTGMSILYNCHAHRTLCKGGVAAGLKYYMHRTPGCTA